ncbi:hypothetical protein [Serratia marcescens]|uniref:hypothetical protein n=1 Tax=Serratia marcescens TaxID=615 RepID=UPI0036F93DE9
MSKFTKVFDQKGTFKALYACETWLRDNGYSYGSSCRGGPTGVLKGDFIIAKWRNLTQKERDGLHGIIEGDFREGPVTLHLKAAPEQELADGQ